MWLYHFRIRLASSELNRWRQSKQDSTADIPTMWTINVKEWFDRKIPSFGRYEQSPPQPQSFGHFGPKKYKKCGQFGLFES